MHAYNRGPDAYYTLNLCARERLDVDADGDTEHPRCVGNCAVWLSVSPRVSCRVARWLAVMSLSRWLRWRPCVRVLMFHY